jgi:signal transduction histidine kinase
VFINLVSNAIDAMDEKAARPDNTDKEKRLTIRSFTANGHVVVKVVDTGTGMTEEIKNKIFEPFYTTKKVGKGTGLGVSISYGIVKDYHGSIEIESEVGKGTTFTLKFPQAAKAQ